MRINFITPLIGDSPDLLASLRGGAICAPKGHESIAQASAWVIFFIAACPGRAAPEGGPPKNRFLLYPVRFNSDALPAHRKNSKPRAMFSSPFRGRILGS